VFQIGVQHLTNEMDHSMKESFYDRNHIGWGVGRWGARTSANGLQAKSVLTKIAAFVADRNVSFLVCSIGMIAMLVWQANSK